MFSTLGPSSDMIDIRMSSGGNAIHASTTRCRQRSTRPPPYAEEIPSTVARMLPRSTAPKPTYSEMRAPYRMRVSTSRPS